jgi:hypothetical protein
MHSNVFHSFRLFDKQLLIFCLDLFGHLLCARWRIYWKVSRFFCSIKCWKNFWKLSEFLRLKFHWMHFWGEFFLLNSLLMQKLYWIHSWSRFFTEWTFYDRIFFTELTSEADYFTERSLRIFVSLNSLLRCIFDTFFTERNYDIIFNLIRF